MSNTEGKDEQAGDKEGDGAERNGVGLGCRANDERAGRVAQRRRETGELRQSVGGTELHQGLPSDQNHKADKADQKTDQLFSRHLFSR